MRHKRGHDLAQAWASDQRRITLGGRVFADGGVEVDGWPGRSPSAQWKEGDGGSHKKATQVFPEVWSAEGLTVRRAIERMSEIERAVLWSVYVEGYGSARRGRFQTMMPRNAFYDHLAHALATIENADILGAETVATMRDN